MKPFLLGVVLVFALAGCGDGGTSPTDAALPGLCSAEVPIGQACNQLANVGDPVTPTCRPEPVPAGAGGTIVDGTYVLKEHIYYNRNICSTVPISGTLVIAGNCMQSITGGTLGATTSATFVVVAPNDVTLSRTCSALDQDTAVTFDAPGYTFTATATTLTLFTNNVAVGNPNPDRAAVFFRR